MSHLNHNLPAKAMMDDLRVKWQEARANLTSATQREREAQTEFLRLYHLLERIGSFNAAEGYKIAKRFQEVVVARRQAKWDVFAWQRVVYFTDATQHKMLETVKRIDDHCHSAMGYATNGPTVQEMEREVI